MYESHFNSLKLKYVSHFAGTGVASMVACYESGADIVDVAMDAMSGKCCTVCTLADRASVATSTR